MAVPGGDAATGHSWARPPVRRVGHRGGVPSANQAAARVATKTASEPLTGQVSSSCKTTVTSGMSRAARIPKERIVRSSGSPDASTAIPSDQTSPKPWWTAPST